MVIIKSKLTGKFLRQHSGSSNKFNGRIRWKVAGDKEFVKTLPAKTEADKEWRADTPRRKAIRQETHRRMYDAEPLEARRFASAGSALTSIGKFNRHPDGPKHTGMSTTFGKYSLPEHLEIHEIVAGNLCIVDVNDDEKTKRRKEKECK